MRRHGTTARAQLRRLRDELKDAKSNTVVTAVGNTEPIVIRLRAELSRYNRGYKDLQDERLSMEVRSLPPPVVQRPP
jgi:hypothetical protein